MTVLPFIYGAFVHSPNRGASMIATPAPTAKCNAEPAWTPAPPGKADTLRAVGAMQRKSHENLECSPIITMP